MKLCLLALLIVLVPRPSSAQTRDDFQIAEHLYRYSLSPSERSRWETSFDLQVFRSSDERISLYRLAFGRESYAGKRVRWFMYGNSRDGGEAMQTLVDRGWPHFESGLRDPDVAWIRQPVNRPQHAELDDLEGSYLKVARESAQNFEGIEVLNRTEFHLGPPLRRRPDGFREASESNLVFRDYYGRVLTLRIRSLRAEGLLQEFGPATHATRMGRRELTGVFARELHRISEALLTETAASPQVRAIDAVETRFARRGHYYHEAWRLLRLAIVTNVANAFNLSEVTPEMVHRVVNTSRLAFLIQFPDETVHPPLLITEESTRRLTQVRVERLADAGATLGLQPGMSIHLRFVSRESLEVRSTSRTEPLSWNAIGLSANEVAATSELRYAIAAVPLTRLRDGLVRVRGPMTFPAYSPSAHPITQAMTELAAQVANVDRELNRLFEIVAIDRGSTVAPFNTFARSINALIERARSLTRADTREIELRAETLRARYEELRTRLSDVESLLTLIEATVWWVEQIERAIQNTEIRHRPAADVWRALTEASRQQLVAFRATRERETRVLREAIEPGLLVEQTRVVTAMGLTQRLRLELRTLPAASRVCRNFFAAR